MHKHASVVIVGAGPAGSSLAIRLVRKGHEVTLIEKDRFPREKLCGEFISPECLRHFRDLGVEGELLAVGGERIVETRFFSKNGRCVSVPTAWFGHEDLALSLSRGVLDNTLLDSAKAAGVAVIEGSRVTGTNVEAKRTTSLDLRSQSGEKDRVVGDLFVDASGRGAILTRPDRPAEKPKLVAFKVHLSGVRPEPGVCELYFFDGGYGGLSGIENGKANFCFIVRADVAKRFIGQTNKLFDFVVLENPRARERMSSATPLHDWLAVTVDRFGHTAGPATENVCAVGDAGAFIDPFTGSGMLMALESSELLSQVLSRVPFRRADYLSAHRRLFRRRLAASSVLRRAAFVPGIASAAISLAGINDRFRSALARATRAGGNAL